MNIHINKTTIQTSHVTGLYNDSSTITHLSKYLSNNITLPFIIFCIGTDRCIGDALGPLTGSILKKTNPFVYIYGTLENPIHALNIDIKLKEARKKHPKSLIIAIDASLGNKDDIGSIIIRKKPLYPGKGVGKVLPPIGDISIVGIVEDADCDITSNIYNIRLHFIMSMAKTIAAIINKWLNIDSFDNPF